MKKIATVVFVAALVATMAGFVANAHATCPGIGGSNETSENFSGAGGNWTTGAATPGTVSASLSGSSNDLLLTELAYTGNNQEFVEIYNPTSTLIPLDNYYLSDDAFTGPTGYWRIVLGGAYTIGTTTDFNVKFPAGATIAPGQAIVIYMGAATSGTPNFTPLPFALGTPDYEICDNSPSVPNMIAIGNIPGGSVTPSSSWNGLLTNGSSTNGEMVMLYKWDGVCDLVCDVDYIGWGNIAAPTVSHRIDKTGISIDGIDADAIASTYLADTPIASQSLGQTHTAGNSIQRIANGAETANGNGCMILVVPVEPTTWGALKTLYR